MKKLLVLAFLAVAVLSGCPSSGGGGDDATGDDDDDAATGIGCRDIAISSGKDGNAAGNSAYYTSALGQATDTSEFFDGGGWAPSTITLCAGVIGSGGRAAITLDADATEAISLPTSNCLCRQFLASGTTGTLYCSASADLLDITSTSDSGGAGTAATAPIIVEGPGAVSGEGHLRVSFAAKTTNIDANTAACTPAACTTALAAVAVETAVYTTGVAKSEFTNSSQGGTESIQATGAPFDDDPNDGTADCEDWTAGAGAGALAGADGHDEDNPDVGGDDVVTIEKIAESP